MSRTPRPQARRVVAIAAATAALASLSACGTNFGAQTNQQYQAAAGANHRSGDIEALGLVLVSNKDGSATVAGSLLNTTRSVEQLTGITARSLEGKKLAASADNSPARLDLPVDQSVQLGEHKTLVAFVDGVRAGGYVTLTLEFSDSPSVTIDVPVVSRTAEYSGIAGSTRAS